MKKNTKKAFTLLEILIGMALLLAASVVLGMKGHEAIERKRFETSIQAFEHTCDVAHRLAVATQTDWQGTLKKGTRGWVFEVVCIEGNRPSRLKPVILGDLQIAKNRNGLPNPWHLQFFSTGKISADGVLMFSLKERKKEVALLEMVGLSEKGALKQPGPVHPQDLSKNRKVAAS